MALPDSTDDEKASSQHDKQQQQQQTSQTKETGDDKDFDPSAQALIDDIDDERTLEEEEAHGDNNQAKVEEELNDLKKESEMPIEELLAYYERMRQQEESGSREDQEEEEEFEEEEEDDDEEDEDEDEEEEGPNDTKNVPPPRKSDDDKDGGGNSSGQGGTKRTAGESPVVKKSVDEKGQPQPKTDSSNSKQHSGHVANQSIQPSSTLDGQLNNPDGNVILTPADSDSNVNNDGQNLSSIDPIVSSEGHHINESLSCYLIQQNTSSIFQALLDQDLDDSEDDDYSYGSEDRSDDERDWRRSIHVGPEFQAEIPEDLSEYDNLPPYQTKDTLVWTCDSNLDYESILDYLKKSSSLQHRKDICISPASVPRITQDSLRQWKHLMATNNEQNNDPQCNDTINNLQDVYMNQSRKRNQIDIELERENTMDDSIHESVNEGTQDSASQYNKPDLSTEYYFQDEEQLLYLLLQCNNNIEEALRRRTLDPFKYYFHEPMSLWSETECLAFESGLRTYGKDFRQIRENKVPTRTHAELVAFYYLWKKSERHDVYTNRYKLDRKRSLTHPGTTDYMDNFIDDTFKLTSSVSPSTPPTNNSTDMNVNVDLCNDSGLATPSCMLSDSRSPQPNTPNNSHGSTNINQKSLLQIHQALDNEEDGAHRETVYLDSNIQL